jgi:hypothetical protein
MNGPPDTVPLRLRHREVHLRFRQQYFPLRIDMDSNPSPYYRPLSATTVSIVIVTIPPPSIVTRHPLLFFCLAGLVSASNRGRVQGSINIAESGIDTLPDISEDEDNDQRDQHKDQRVFDHRLPVHTLLLEIPLDRRHCRHECFHCFFSPFSVETRFRWTAAFTSER